MINSLLFTLILPFIPTFLLGGYYNTVKISIQSQTNNTYCQNQSQERCVPSAIKSDNSEGTVESAQSGLINENDFSKKNLLPTDNPQTVTLPEKVNQEANLKLWAGSSVAIDVNSGTILHYDEGKKKTQVASLTKMMTAILVMEKIKDLNEEVSITREALKVPGTVIGCPRSGYCPSNRLYVGEKVKAIDLLKAMLMNSANDAATALGIHIAGSTEKFVQIMNDKAKSLGYNDTNFCTPSGLEIDGREDQCYSTAYDIARIAAYSLQYDKIWEIMRIPDAQIYSCDGKYMHQLNNTDLLLSTMSNCLGGKTGFTPMAGKSLLLGSSDPSGKHKIIAVILNDEKRWEDMKTLVDWVFTNYKWK
jgi:D-alanyl-D-alanine carboxypeptidase